MTNLKLTSLSLEILESEEVAKSHHDNFWKVLVVNLGLLVSYS